MTDKKFESRNKKFVELMNKDLELKKLSRKWFDKAFSHEYSFHFSWLGLPIIQFPQDIIALQEIIWKIKPDLIIETGIARGGSLIFLSSMLEMIGNGEVVGIDIDIRKPNRKAIENHPMYKRITMIEGSSINTSTVKRVFRIAKGKQKVMLILDSNHTHKHVLKELKFYSPLVKTGSYIVVFDTIVEEMPENFFPNRPWKKGNNPKTAVLEFLKTNNRFRMDRNFEKKLLITSSPSGFLKCVR